MKGHPHTVRNASLCLPVTGSFAGESADCYVLVKISLVSDQCSKLRAVTVLVILTVKRLMYLMSNPGTPGVVTVKTVAPDLHLVTVSS